MVQPINYMSQIPQPDLGQSLLSGLQLGTSIREIQEKRVAAQQAEAAKVAFRADFQNAKDNPTQENWLKMIATYPQYREAFSEVRKGFGEVETQKEFDAAYPISTAFDNGRPEIASKLTVDLIAARKNAKLPTQIYEQIFNEMELGNFKGAQAGVNYLLTNTNPERFEKFTKARVAAQAAPATLRKTEADADEAVSKAEIKTAEGYTLLPEDERLKLKLPAGTYQKGPKGEVKLLAATKEDFKLLSAAEVKAAGLPAGTYQQSPSGEIKPIVKEPLVSVTVGDQRKRDDLALKELDVPRAQEFSASAASTRGFARDARVIANLLKGRSGGAAIKLGVDIAKTFGFETDTVTANDLANSLAVRGATQIRPPGSGSTSDIEFRAFVSAFPSLANSEGGRELMAKYGELFAKRTAKLADHARRLIRSDTYSEEEMARYDESLGPLLSNDFYASVNEGPRAGVPRYTPPAAPAPAPAPAAPPRTLGNVLQQYLNR